MVSAGMAAPCCRWPSTSTATSAPASCRRSSASAIASSGRISRPSGAAAEILHPAVRAGLEMLGYDDSQGIELFHQGDLPARSGIGSSSAFAVGLINVLNAMRGKTLDAHALASERHGPRAEQAQGEPSAARTRSPAPTAASTSSSSSATIRSRSTPLGLNDGQRAATSRSG